MPEKLLGHFALFAFADDFWRLPPEPRRDALTSVVRSTEAVADRVNLYQIYPARADADFLLFSAVAGEAKTVTADFAARFATACSTWRRLARPVEVLWGLTRPSVYYPGQSSQLLDPLRAARRPYLVIYPFSKTTAWYLMSREARQGIMNEHIRIGKQYPEISQLLLYSVGLADQEFVVVYETDDLEQFSDLVNTLRATEVRRYTLRDTPIYTAIHRRASEFCDLWAGGPPPIQGGPALPP